jgi:hydrogenase maturation protease
MKQFGDDSRRRRTEGFMPQTLIVGYGNPLRRDDGLGWQAAAALLYELPSAGVEVMMRQQLTPELAETISHASAVFFIDASCEGAPGELSFKTVTPLQDVHFGHEVSPASLLNLSLQLYSRCPRAFAVSLCGEAFGHGEGLSPKVLANLPHLVRLVAELVLSGYDHGEAAEPAACPATLAR